MNPLPKATGLCQQCSRGGSGDHRNRTLKIPWPDFFVLSAAVAVMTTKTGNTQNNKAWFLMLSAAVAVVTTKTENTENTKAWFLCAQCSCSSGDHKNWEHPKYQGLIPHAQCSCGSGMQWRHKIFCTLHGAVKKIVHYHHAERSYFLYARVLLSLLPLQCHHAATIPLPCGIYGIAPSEHTFFETSSPWFFLGSIFRAAPGS